MNGVASRFSKLLLLVFVMCGVMALAYSDARAQGDDCIIDVCKQLRGSNPDDSIFEFIVQGPDGISRFSLGFDDCTDLRFPFGSTLAIREVPQAGWRFVDVGWETSNIIVSEIDHGVSLECFDSGFGEFFFGNTPGDDFNIPTLSQWGMIAAAAGLLIVGAFYAVRRKKAAV